MENSIQTFTHNGKDHLSIPAERKEFVLLQSWLSDIAATLTIPKKIKNAVLLASDEVFTNIASYGYPDGTGYVNIWVSFNIADQQIILTFVDSGLSYNPLTAAEPDTSLPLPERGVGGLGLFLVKKLMDSVEYRREDDKNILTLKKRVCDGEPR